MPNFKRWMRSLLWGAHQAQLRQRYIDFIGESPYDYTDACWSLSMETAAHHSKHLRNEYQWQKQEGK